MKKLQLLLPLLLALLLASGCKMTTIEYNDMVVEALDTNSTTIQATVEAYDQIVPNLVTEESEIIAVEMRESLETAKIVLNESESILLAEGRNEEQQTEVRTELANYFEQADLYLQKYEEMVIYYENHTYKENPNLVSDYDSELFDEGKLFDNFLGENNNLAEILKSYL